MNAFVAPTLYLRSMIHSQTHPHKNPVYELTAFSYLPFDHDVNTKDFQNYNSGIDFSPKITITFLMSTKMASKLALKTEIITFHQMSI